MDTSNPIDPKAVRRLYSTNPCARALLDQFAKRQQDRSEVTIDRLAQLLASDGYEFSRTEIIDAIRQLQSLGAGSFVVGRKGHDSRFVRSVNLAELGKLAGGDGEVQTAVPQIPERPLPDKEEMVIHRFVLRPGFTVVLQLPADFSPGEATRMSDFIKTLPFTVNQ